MYREITTIIPSSSHFLLAITSGPTGGYVAVGYDINNDTIYATSPDGETWAAGTGPIQGNLYGITYDAAGGYVAVGADTLYLTSPDGVSWTGGTGPIYGDLYGIAYGPIGGYVAVGNAGTIIEKSTSDTDGLCPGIFNP